MYGSHVGTLNVRIKRMVRGKPTSFLMWSKSGENGNRWWITQVHKDILKVKDNNRNDFVTDVFRSIKRAKHTNIKK